MHKMLFICPSYGDKVEALSAHTSRLVDHFGQNNLIAILCSTNYSKSDEIEYRVDQGIIQVISVQGKWNFFGLLKTFKPIGDFNPDTIFIQYVPFLYGRGGINFSFPIFVMMLRFLLRKKLTIYFHELFYPMEAKIKSIVMNISHTIMLYMLGYVCHKVLTTTESFKRNLKQLLIFKKNIYHLAVGSNIKKIEISKNENEQFKKRFEINPTDLVLGSFGTFHPSKNYKLIFEIISKIKTETDIPLKFIMIGQDEDSVREYLGSTEFSKIQEVLIAPGKLSDYEINLAMNVMDVYIGYFVDGITSRRSSLITAMQAGLPIISTCQESSDVSFYDQEHIYLYSIDEKVFAQAVFNLIRTKALKFKTDGKINHNLFDEVFSWKKIFENFERFSSEEK